MKNFLAVFTGTAEATERSGWNTLNEQSRQERAQAAWPPTQSLSERTKAAP